MGLSATLQQTTVAAFKALGDLAKPATYQSLTGAVTRDVAAGTSVAVSVPYTLKRVMFVRFEEDENDKDINVTTDQKMLFPAADLPVEPKAADIVVDYRGRTWEIIKRKSDPASALVILVARTSR